MPAVLEDRLRIQVEIALADSCGCAQTRARQENRARAVGLSGAEIDSARAGRCFDMRANAAVVLACALRKDSTPPGAPVAGPLAAKARRAGLSLTEIAAVQAMVQVSRADGRTEQSS